MKPRLTNEVVRGTPIDVNGHVLVPEARVTSWAAREATLGMRDTKVAGVRFTRIRPTALIEYTPDGERSERRHRIEDPTGRALLGLAIAAAVVPLVLDALVNRFIATR